MRESGLGEWTVRGKARRVEANPKDEAEQHSTAQHRQPVILHCRLLSRQTFPFGHRLALPCSSRFSRPLVHTIVHTKKKEKNIP